MKLSKIKIYIFTLKLGGKKRCEISPKNLIHNSEIRNRKSKYTVKNILNNFDDFLF